MGRWLSSVRGEASENESAEKIQKCLHIEHSKPSKPIQEGVLKVSKVPYVNISEKFFARATVRQPIPHKLSKLPKGGFEGFVSDQGGRVFGIDRPPEPDEAELEERKGMAMDSVPEPYVDAAQRVSDGEW